MHLGTWKVEGNKLIHDTDASASPHNNTNAYVALKQEGTKLTYEWTVEFVKTSITTGPSAGMHILSSDAVQGANRGNSYMIWQDKSRIQVYKTSNGNLGKVVKEFEVPVEAGSKHTYRVIVDVAKGELRIYRDGSLVGTVEDAEPYSSGSYLSVRTNGTQAIFTDIKVSVVE